MFKILAFSGLLAGLLGFSVAATATEDSRPLEYGYPDQSVWTTRLNDQGQLDNPLLRLAGRIFDEAGLEWTSRAYPAKRLFKSLKDGSVPFTMLVRASSLQECCLFGSEPLTSTTLRVFRAGDTAAIQAKEDLASKRVIVIRGYSYGAIGKFLRDPGNSVELVEAARHEEAFELFRRGRGDYVLDYQGPALEAIGDLGLDALASDVLRELDVFLVLNKNFPDAEALMARLQAIASGLDREAILKASQ
ncbi:MAG: substrate-binding periplasmic protein [Magnetovibrionaceae bacterium]